MEEGGLVLNRKRQEQKKSQYCSRFLARSRPISKNEKDDRSGLVYILLPPTSCRNNISSATPPFLPSLYLSPSQANHNVACQCDSAVFAPDGPIQSVQCKGKWALVVVWRKSHFDPSCYTASSTTTNTTTAITAATSTTIYQPYRHHRYRRFNGPFSPLRPLYGSHLFIHSSPN